MLKPRIKKMIEQIILVISLASEAIGFLFSFVSGAFFTIKLILDYGDGKNYERQLELIWAKQP